MAFTSPCPSCGAAVVFRSAASVLAVCDYCQATLIREDMVLSEIGRMAALAEDRSPLQLGAEGRYQGVHFALIGRLQLRYAQGTWNEWFLLFDDMRTGWLSEANGTHAIYFRQVVSEPLPAFDSLRPGQRLSIGGMYWSVANIDSAECVAGAGELPFRVGAGYPVPAVDLRNAARKGAHLATLDYSESPPWYFLGQSVEFGELNWQGLREGVPVPEKKVAARAFLCPACGAPLSARSPDILTVGCAACGAVLDPGRAEVKVLSRTPDWQNNVLPPFVPLGTLGKLDGQTVELIGHLVRESKTSGSTVRWQEYLLASPEGAYVWLTEYRGHWNRVEVLPRQPVMESDRMRYDGVRYAHYASEPVAEVVQVTGEFNWRVSVGDSCGVDDYIAPPLMLSRETSSNEESWSRGEYLPAEAVAAAFGRPSLPEPEGVFANQPNPWQDTMGASWRLFGWLFLIVALVQALSVWLAGERQIHAQPVSFNEESVSAPFVVKGWRSKLLVRTEAALDNNWLALDMALINQATGEAWPASRELAYYHGIEDGERWAEGGQGDEVAFHDLPAGTYYLALSPELSPDTQGAQHGRIMVRKPGAVWSNSVLALGFLIIFPLFALSRRDSFEMARQREGDHPPADDDDGETD